MPTQMEAARKAAQEIENYYAGVRVAALFQPTIELAEDYEARAARNSNDADLPLHTYFLNRAREIRAQLARS